MRIAVLSFTGILGLVLSIAASLVFAGLEPPAARAAGGEIRVVEAQQQVNYPAGVNLSVTVESDAKIDEVRVYYRPVGSRRWGYAYADFNPGTRVVATRTIPVRESTYIAPGAEVEYYFDIRDAEGNSFKTDRVVVEYLDQRFDWHRVRIGPLELVYHDIDDQRIEKAAQQLREDLRRVEELLRLDQSETFKGVIYNSYADANAAFPVQSQTTTDHGTFAGYAFPEQGVFVGQGLDSRVIVHESAHLLLRQALGQRVVELPTWLNEGFATYVEPNVRVRSSNELYAQTPHLKAMKRLSGTPETIPLFYRKSVSVVAHLIEEYGADNFRRLLDEIGSGRTIKVALINVYGFDDHGLDSSWAGLPIPDPPASKPENRRPARAVPTMAPNQPDSGPDSDRPAAVPTPAARAARSTPAAPHTQEESPSLPRSTPAPPVPAQQVPAQQVPAQQREGPSPFVFIDVWMLSGVALLAAGAVALRFVYTRLRRKDDSPYDQRQDWEGPDLDIN